jgi:uncharacterized membrane protein YgcG
MLKRPSDHRLTVEERVAVVVAIAVAVGVHVAVFVAGMGIGSLVHEEKKRERMMVIRRVREITPAPDIAVKVPDPRRPQVAAEPGPEGRAGSAPPAPKTKTSEHGTQAPPPKSEISPKMEEDLQETLDKEQEASAKPTETKGGEIGDNSVSVVTDLPASSFTVSGPVEYRGTGTFWIRKGAPAGTYRITFAPIEGYGMPPPQTKELPEKGQIVFVGKYRRSTEVAVEANDPNAQFTIFRPDGRPIDLSRPGRALFDDLPPGNYTAVFKDVPGHVTPAPLSSVLSPGGKLSFYGNYKDATGSGAGGGAGAGTGTGSGSAPGSGSGTGSRGTGPGGGGSGSGSGRGGKGLGGGAAELDRRVQLVVKSYPKTDIEDYHAPIAYPEVIIRKSNFQQGWCQVYLILMVDENGAVGDVIVERPRPQDRAQYESLIRAVEASVRTWDYDRVPAEVHVDVRFYVE